MGDIAESPASGSWPGSRAESTCALKEDTMEPYSLEFNAAVMTMANRVCPCGYDVSDAAHSAPDSLAALNKHIETTRRILVSRDHSDNTIFSDPEINWAFRAWHDWTHWRIQAEFDLVGEVEVALRQVKDLTTVYGPAFGNRYQPIIFAEGIGHTLLKELTGKFPIDQRRFDAAFLGLFGPALPVVQRRMCGREQHDVAA
ncbi:MAG: hypothetical protein KGL39_03170 [Patescibacteria group bacterium]|nr:hypothetical protein [Patescibacteria group bacterium]